MRSSHRKILFLSGHAHRALDPAAAVASGGAELQVALLATALVRRGIETVIAAASDGFADGVVWRGVCVRDAGRFDTGTPWETLAALRRVWRVLREEHPQWVIVYGWTTWLTILCLWRPFLKTRIGFVCALDSEIDGGFQRNHPLRGRIFTWGLRWADARLSITGHQARLFRSQGMSCSVTRLLLQPTSESTPTAKSVDLLWVARCHPVKRPHAFLDLLERLPGIRARMICSPQDHELMRTVRARAATLTGLEFLEGVPYREIQSHFSAARIFVNTSLDEGVPNTFLHAALGRTAIASLLVDPDGMITNFHAGICAEGDFETLVCELTALLDSPDSILSAAAGAARILEEWHDNDRNVTAFLEGLGP